MTSTKQKSSSKRSGVFLSLFIDAGLPYIAFVILQNVGVMTVPALILSSIFPIFNVALDYRKTHKVDGFGVFIVTGLLLGVVTTVISNNPHYILVKEAIFTSFFGLLCLGSMFRGKPLTFYYGRKFGTDGSTESFEKWDRFWDKSSHFRSGTYFMTALWATAFIGEAVVRVILSYTLTVNQFLAVSNIVFIVTVVSLITFSTIFGKGYLAKKTQADLKALGLNSSGLPILT